MLVRVLYFAGVRDVTGRDEESLTLSDDVTTVGELERVLFRRYPALEAQSASLRFARNEAFADTRDAIEGGDVIAVIPPVAGG
jgi:molybdopterin synthase sulfur carrier subunit